MVTQASKQPMRWNDVKGVGPLVAGTLIAGAGVALAAFVGRFWLGLPTGHVKDLGRLLLLSGGASLLVTLVAAWLLLGHTEWRLAPKLSLACAIGPIVAGINTYYTADSMLIKQSDLGLLILLLVFSSGVGIAFALALARMLTARLGLLARAAAGIGHGVGTIAAPEGEDEVGVLGRTLNDLEARLEESDSRRKAMEEARRMLLAAVSHDLRTPLTSLRAVVEALDDGVVEDRSTVTRYLASARQQVRQLETLIDDLFELSRLDAGALHLDRRAMHVSGLVDEAMESVRVQADAASIRLETRLDAELPLVFVDGERIGRVLLNLLSNALRYTPEGGTIALLAQHRDGGMQVSVQDSGAGIAPDDLPHIFESFYRGEKSRSRLHGGAGLGLAIARGLVEAHGGHMWAESAPGSGTSVHFTLPASASMGPGLRATSPVAASSRPAPDSSPSLNGHCTLRSASRENDGRDAGKYTRVSASVWEGAPRGKA